MARKYGIVSAHDVKIAAPRGADFQTGSINMARKPLRPIMSPSPGLARPGTGLGLTGVASSIGNVVRQTRNTVQQQSEKKTADARAATMPLHPSAAPRSAVASRTGGNPIGALRDHPAVQSADAIYTAPRGMGAKVPASRAAKFAQGRTGGL